MDYVLYITGLIIGVSKVIEHFVWIQNTNYNNPIKVVVADIFNIFIIKVF